jgi:Arc/MetJ-type ribon-helix-helix transcriptional regulator
MTIHLSGDREEFVRSLVQGAEFASEDAVVDEALRLFQELDEQGKLADGPSHSHSTIESRFR